jgi:peroxiredoxin
VVRSGRIDPRVSIIVAVFGLIALPLSAFAVAVGDRAPDFSLTDQFGASHSLSGNAGKVRLIYFFGHSAQVCAETARQIEVDFQTGYAAKGLVVLGLECWDGTEQQLREFATANQVSYPLLGGAGATARQYDLPYHSFVVIDTGGVVRLAIQGPDASAYDRAEIEKTVKSLLEDPSASEEQTWGAIKVLFSR